MKRIAVLFSGQGSQYLGMGKRLYDRDDSVKMLFRTASDLLDMDMVRLCFDGKPEELNRTENTQPALLLVSIALYRNFRARTGLTPAFVAGHSLGEISALVGAEALSFEDGLRLARRRGLAMSRCTAPGEAGMYAVTQMEQDRVEEICRAVEGFGADFVIANFNAPSQMVLSGNIRGLEKGADVLKKSGGTIIPLKVSGPFHSPFMAPAADDLAEALAGIEFREPKIPVIANISATPHGAGDTIGNALVRQLTSPVLWSETMRFLRSQEVDLYLEAGPRDVLKKLVLTNLPGSTAFALDEQGDETLIEQDLAADIRAVKERPNVVGKCLAVAVCTKNNNWNEEEYQKGVVEPYRQLQAMQERLEQEAAAPDLDEMKQALALLGRIFATKGTPADERELRLRQIIETTGNEEILGDYTFLTA